MNQIANMVMRIFLRKVISKGMDKGFDMASGVGRKGRNADKGEGEPAAPRGGHGVSDADRAEMEAMRQNQKRAKQAMRVTRRMNKF